MAYSMAWWASHGIMVWPGMHGGHHMVLWYGMIWGMVWPGGHRIVYGLAGNAWSLT